MYMTLLASKNAAKAAWWDINVWQDRKIFLHADLGAIIAGLRWQEKWLIDSGSLDSRPC